MMENSQCDIIFGKSLPFWHNLTPNEKTALCKNTTEAMYQKGQIIHSPGGKCTGAILIKSGSARAYLLSDSGKEVTLFRLFPGDICTLSASCVFKAITFDVYIDAQTYTECYKINGAALADLTQQNTRAKIFALETTVSRFSDVVWVLEQIMFMSFDKRLAIFLKNEAKNNNSSNIALTKEQIAKYTGSAREVVSRMLSYFTTEGIVEPYRGGVKIINFNKLDDIINN